MARSSYVKESDPVFYSDVPGSGNQMSYDVTLPRDPSPKNPLTPGKSYNFQLTRNDAQPSEGEDSFVWIEPKPGRDD